MNGKPIVTKGTCKQYMIQDGKFLQSDFTFFNSDGTKDTGTGISGFDSKTNRFTTVWYGSRQTTMSIRQSDGTFGLLESARVSELQRSTDALLP
jgi:hypothetical protein